MALPRKHENNPYILFSDSCCLPFGPLCLSCCLTLFQVLPTRIALQHFLQLTFLVGQGKWCSHHYNDSCLGVQTFIQGKVLLQLSRLKSKMRSTKMWKVVISKIKETNKMWPQIRCTVFRRHFWWESRSLTVFFKTVQNVLSSYTTVLYNAVSWNEAYQRLYASSTTRVIDQCPWTCCVFSSLRRLLVFFSDQIAPIMIWKT